MPVEEKTVELKLKSSMNFALASNRKPSNEKALCSSLAREAARGVPEAPARKIQNIREMEKRELKVGENKTSNPFLRELHW